MTRKELRQREKDFYSLALEEAERVELEEARSVEGVDQEIALLRVILRSLLEESPPNIPLQLETARTLARLVRLRYQLTPQARDNLAEAISEVLKEVGGSLGILGEQA